MKANNCFVHVLVILLLGCNPKEQSNKYKINNIIIDNRKSIYHSIINQIDSAYIPEYAFTVPFNGIDLEKYKYTTFYAQKRVLGTIQIYNMLAGYIYPNVKKGNRKNVLMIEFPYRRMEYNYYREYYSTLLLLDYDTKNAAYIMWLNQPANFKALQNFHHEPYFKWEVDIWTDTIISSIQYSEIKDIFPTFNGVICNKILDSIILPNIDINSSGGYEKYMDSIYLKFRYNRFSPMKGIEPPNGNYLEHLNEATNKKRMLKHKI